jgi:AcrR family transcriptional regulator
VVDPRLPYYAAAMDLLAEEGFGGLKQASLCKRIGVTTGAFYHNFASWQDFTDQLLDHWHKEKTTDLATFARAQAGAEDQLEALIEASCRLPHTAEAAIRVWARIDPRVRTHQEAVDAEREAIVREAFTQLVGAEEAVRYAQAGMYLLIGFEQSTPPADLRGFEWSIRTLLRSATDAARAASSPQVVSN